MKKTKVYVVCETCNGEFSFMEVFSDKKEAEHYMDANRYSVRIGEKFVLLERKI